MTERKRSQTKAYQHPGFLNSKDARPLRILSEYLEPKSRFDRHKIDDTIVFMGSARIKSREDAEAMLDKAKSGKERERAQMALKMSAYYEAARELAFRVTHWSKELDHEERRFVVCTGGGPGIMEAANRGAHDVGAKTVGFDIVLPHEQLPNHYITRGLGFTFRYFAIRKMHFMLRAKALVAFPGGFGTMDELFEALTLVQTGKVEHLPVVLVGRAFWEKVLNVPHLVENGLILPEDLRLFRYAETADEAWRQIVAYHAGHGQA
jgi:uncharacterized protein (TIGR00730 family)